MDLTKEHIDEIIKEAKDVDFGSVSILISGPETKKIVDIVTEKRKRFEDAGNRVPAAPVSQVK
jgi:hypothetical protein